MKTPAKPAKADPADSVKTGAQVARQSAAAAQAKGVAVEVSRAFTLNRDDGTTRAFLPGLNKGVSKGDADHWYVKAHTVGEAKSGVADARPLMDPNGTGDGAASAYGEDDALADMARAEAGDADAKARVDAYAAAMIASK